VESWRRKVLHYRWPLAEKREKRKKKDPENFEKGERSWIM